MTAGSIERSGIIHEPLVFVRANSQCEGHIWVLEMSLDSVMELFSVLVELHDAFWFLRHPEFIKFICQIT